MHVLTIVVHVPTQDLKPSNLLVTADGIVKIADFGCATQFGSPSRVYTPVVVTLYAGLHLVMPACIRWLAPVSSCD